MNRNADESSSGSSDFFSPISLPFLPNRNKTGSGGINTAQRTPFQDSSWIGARLSPIHSFDKEAGVDDDEDDQVDELDQQQQQRLSLHRAPFVTERSTLLGNQHHILSHQQNVSRTRSQSKIHPLWESPLTASTSRNGTFRNSSKTNCTPFFGHIVCALSGIHLVVMALFDTLESYRLYRTGAYDDDDPPSNRLLPHLRWWSLPFLTPPHSTLRLFGALAPSSITQWNSRYILSCVTCLWISTSVVEWLLIVGAWRLIRISQLRSSNTTAAAVWPTFVAASITGQLWMWAYDDATMNRTVGALGWGTNGVLCAVGMHRPGYRFELYIVCTLLLVLSLWQERELGSVWGATAGAFCGWALGAAVGCAETALKEHPVPVQQWVTLLGTVMSMGIVTSPVVSLAFPGASTTGSVSS